MPTNVKNVLVVDPQPKDYEVLSLTLGGRLQIRILQTGRDALNVAMHDTVDTWIINVSLPDMTGFELHQNLRERYSGARFVLVGNDYRPDDEVKARTSGAARYLCKPPQPWWLEQIPSGNTAFAKEA